MHMRLLFLAVLAALPGLASPEVVKSFRLVKTDLTVNEPVFLTFSVENQLPHTVEINRGSNDNGCCGFFARIVRPDGRTEYGPKFRADELVGGPNVTITPYSTHSEELLVNKWFKFDVPGRYILDVENASPFGRDPTPTYSGPSIIIDVGPRNAARLEEICMSLEIEAGAFLPRDVRPAFRAAEILLHMNDPVTVPYIGRLLEMRGASEYLLIRALEAIANGPAVDILIVQLSRTDRGDIQLQSRSSLARIAQSTSDPILKLKADAALKDSPR
jgi:hypothetical protein